jgi:hypothetical protein
MLILFPPKYYRRAHLPASTTMLATLRRLTRAAPALVHPTDLLFKTRLHLDPTQSIDLLNSHSSPETTATRNRHALLGHFETCRGFGPAIATRLIESGCRSWADVIEKDDKQGSGVALRRSQKIYLYHHLMLDVYLEGEDVQGVIGQWAARVVRI